MTSQPPELLLKTRQVARALGVSVSTIKRWVDAGELSASKTVGRHRLIPASSALEFARRYGLPEGDLARMSRAEAPIVEVVDDRVRDALEQALRTGRAREAQALIHAAHGVGADAAALADHLIRPVMERIGHGWQFGTLEVYHEHRASQIVGAALADLIPRSRPERGRAAPLAMGATPEGDLYTLTGQLCELLLGGLGWEVVNLGPNLPLPSLAKAVRSLRPRLAWLSVNHLADPAGFPRDYEALHEAARMTGAAVILGGRALGPELRAQLVATSFGERLAHLAELARQLHPTADAQAARTTDRPTTAHPEAN